MTNEIIAEFEAVFAKVKAALTPAVETVEADAEAIGSATLSYIKANGLEDLYQLALTIVGGAVAGTPWTATLAAVAAQGITDGKQLEQGAVAVVAAQAQADLISAGKLLAPVPSAAA